MNKLLLSDDKEEADNPMAPRTDILVASDIDIQIMYGMTTQTGHIR